MKSLFLLTLFTCQLAIGQVPFRKYKPGEKFRYTLITESFRNNEFDSKTVSFSKHTVVSKNNHYSEEVEWVGKIVLSKNTKSNLYSAAIKVKPYNISLEKGAMIRLPKLTVPQMVGEITDLNTFYVAVSPALHAQRLSAELPQFTDSLVHGNFADSIQILLGEDCMQVTQKLLAHTKKTTTIQTTFSPPRDICIKPVTDTIARNIFGANNNFQMIRRSIPGKVNLMWGVEQFTIVSVLDNSNGQIIQANMQNTLRLRLRANADSDLKNYVAELPLTLKRVIYLRLEK